MTEMFQKPNVHIPEVETRCAKLFSIRQASSLLELSSIFSLLVFFTFVSFSKISNVIISSAMSHSHSQLSLDREKEDDVTLPHANTASNSSQHDIEKDAELDAPPNATTAAVPDAKPPGPPGPPFAVPEGGLTAWLQVLGGFMVSA